MRIIFFYVASVLLLASCAVEKKATELIYGEWTIDYKGCKESYKFNRDGTRLATSYKEISNGRFSVSSVNEKNKVIKLIDEVTESNLKPSCHGNPTPVGSKIDVFAGFSLDYKQMVICGDEALSDCYIALHRVLD